GCGERFPGLDLDERALRILRVGLRRRGDRCEPDGPALVARVVHDEAIVRFHRGEVSLRDRVPDARPDRLLLLEQHLDGILGRLPLQQPVAHGATISEGRARSRRWTSVKPPPPSMPADPSAPPLSREIVAGVTTFLTMSYIIVVNPAILSTPGTGLP